jgi:predicted metal-dependent peptidase
MLALNQALTAEQRLQKAVMSIMANDKYVGLSSVLMIGDRTVDDTVPTACTNGRDEMYGRAFVDGLNDAELRFLILHECYHKMYQHLTTWKHLYDKHPQVANAACDYVINIQLVDGDNGEGFIKMPKVGLLDAEYRNMDSAQVFHKIYDSLPEGDDGRGVGDSLDDHGWEEAEQLSEEEKGDLEREVEEAIRQGVLVAGKLGSGGARDLEELLKPQIDWRDVLREFISTTCAGKDFSTWARPNRRFVSTGVYMPSGISEKVGELVIAIDTSASIGQRELTTFLSEIKSVCDNVRPERIRLLYWDTRVCADETYDHAETDTLVQSTKPAGGGGTDVSCVSEYMAEHKIDPQAVIVFTDGYVFDWGTWTCPILWAIYDYERAKPDCGKVVHIAKNKL